MVNNMENAVIIGVGGQSRVIISILRSICDETSIRLVDPDNRATDEIIMGIEVENFFAFDWSNSEHNNFYIALGDNKHRDNMRTQLSNKKLRMPSLISPSAIIDPTVVMGDSNVICALSFLGPNSGLGENNLINTGAIIEHEVKIGNSCHIAPNATLLGRSSIGNFCFLGSGSVVRENVSIQHEITLGAGAVILQNIEECACVYVGVPAIKKR